ncbi:MAG: hypothetical protein COV76_01395 [Candidatus Omnitrophica bacterium CG11_big_fil_rev_8_21_14_0_20_64_10]|nr:MAG: hypothetical protein COV76_01395 [Candidatus Omnitrophica bacterium CG11_big_fil_rev_8_21_14_0_20_64_10]
MEGLPLTPQTASAISAWILAVVLGFYLVVFPIWMLVHLFIQPERSVGGKVAWALGILLLPFGATLYGLFGSRRTGVQFVALMFGPFLALSVYALFVAGAQGYDWGRKPASLVAIERLGQVEAPDISLQEMDQMKYALQKLAEPGSPTAREEFGLIAALHNILQDGLLSQQEYDRWIQAYWSRAH